MKTEKKSIFITHFQTMRTYFWLWEKNRNLRIRQKNRPPVFIFGVTAAIILFTLLLQSPVLAMPSGDELWEEQKEVVDLRIIEEYWQEITGEVEEFMPHLELNDIFDWMRGREESTLDLMGIFKGLSRYLFREVMANLYLMGRLVILAVVAALLKNLQQAFSSSQLSSIAQGIIFILLMSIALQSFALASSIGQTVIGRMVDIIMALIPLLLTLLASLGSLASAAIFQPVIIFSASFIGLLIKDLVFPLIFFATVLLLLDSFSENHKISRLGLIFRDAAVFIMGLSLTIFVGILSISGIAGAVSDGVTLRTAKFVTGIFIPVVGGMVAEALEAVIGASLILKNGLILAGMVLLFLTLVFPLLKIISIVFIYKFSAALIQPLGESSLGDCLNTMGNSLLLIFAAVVAVSLIFFILLVIIMGAGNAAVMFRT